MPVALFIVLVGLTNLALGYAAALALAEPPFLRLSWNDLRLNVARLAQRLSRRSSVPGESAEVSGEGNYAGSGSPPQIATANELPEAWLELLRREGLRAELLADGAAHFLRFQAAAYREQLLTAEARARQALSTEDAPALEQLCSDLQFVNRDFVRKAQLGAELLRERNGRLGPGEAAAREVEQAQLDHAAQILAIDREIHEIDFRADVALGCRSLIAQMQSLIDLAHGQRDHLTSALGKLLRSQQQLTRLERRHQFDALTGLMSGLGLAAMFQEQQEGNGSKPTAAMLITLDRFGRMNQRLGTRAGDFALRACGELVSEIAREASPTHVVARIDGCGLVVISREGTAAEMIALGEQMRQTFEAAAFQYQGTEFSLHLSVAVAPIEPGDELDVVLARLDKARQAAFAAGHNRTTSWEEGRATVVPPPAIPIASRIVVVQESVAA